MLKVENVDWLDPRAIAQREAMNAETGAMYERFLDGQTPETQAAIRDALSVDDDEILRTILAVHDATVVGHAALRQAPGFGSEVLEVKKVFVGAEHRGLGASKLLMAELEVIARSMGATSLVLQTGELQIPAIALYEAIGYTRIPRFGKYTAMPHALCYSKAL